MTTYTYDDRGYAAANALIPESVAHTLLTRLRNNGEPPQRSGKDGLELYGDPVFDDVLLDLLPKTERMADCRLYPTYSFARLYVRGQDLPLHRDRPACEHSISVHLGAAQASPWALWVRDTCHNRVAVNQAVGDGVFYQGIARQHWRGPCPVDWYAQAFFHYVDRDGAHAGERFDRRPGLRLPASTKSEAKT